MAKQFSIYLVMSILLVIFAAYVRQLLVYLDMGYAYLNIHLTHIFSSSATGTVFRHITILMLLPLVIAGVPALVYRFIKKSSMPYFYHTLWITWMVTLISQMMIN
jgi:hypothetical protein